MKEKHKDVNYFDMFIDAAGICHRSAVLLHSLMQDYTDVQQKCEAIHEVEHEGDNVYHTLYSHLNREFITPIEREDILEVAQYIDDTTDAIEDVASRFYMLSIQKVHPAALPMAELIERITHKLVEAAKEFKHFKRSKHLPELIVEINTLEEEGDRLYRSAVRNLFFENNDPIEIMKWRDIFEVMETAVDACENVAQLMEGVTLKNS